MTRFLKSVLAAVNHPLFARVKLRGKSLDAAMHAHRILVKYSPICALGIVTNLTTLSLISFYAPTSTNYTHTEHACTFGASLFPRSVSAQNSASFTASQPSLFSINGMPILSLKTCVSATNLPKIGESEKLALRQFGLPFTKRISVTPRAFPNPSARLLSQDKLSTKSNLIFDIASGASHVIRYTVTTGSTSAPCTYQDSAIICKVPELLLEQGREYDIILMRTLGSVSEPAFSQRFTTVEPVSIADSSIAQNATVYDVPQSLEIRFSKSVKSFNGAKLQRGPDNAEVPVVFTLAEDGMSMTVSWAEPLPRAEQFKLDINSLVAIDGAYLDQPYSLVFSTSTGPRVKSISIESYMIETRPEITIEFDQPVDPSQNLLSILSLSDRESDIALDGSILTIRPLSAYGRCEAFTLYISDKLTSIYGISGGNGFTHSARTICQRVSSIGTSVEGRAILAYSFGNGNSEILFIGATHGSEKSSAYTLDSWIDYLEQNPSTIPGDKTVVVIPRINPDGFAVTRRTNANNVDLNRNFPANNWKASVKMPGGNTLEQGGGVLALSEPESDALARYVLSHRPRFTLTYHSRGGIVIGNGSGDSFSVAANYADIVGYGDESSTAISEVFTHDTTGAFEDWLRDKESMPALLIELDTHTSNEFWRHRPAMLDVLSI